MCDLNKATLFKNIHTNLRLQVQVPVHAVRTPSCGLW